jgi:hypothetical protein
VLLAPNDAHVARFPDVTMPADLKIRVVDQAYGRQNEFVFNRQARPSFYLLRIAWCCACRKLPWQPTSSFDSARAPQNRSAQRKLQLKSQLQGRTCGDQAVINCGSSAGAL